MWRVPREWAGETAFIVCGGPSVREVDLARLRGHKVVVVNSSYIAVPWADYLVFTDLRWWKQHRNMVRRTFGGRVVTLTPMSETFEDILVLNRQRSGGLSDDPTRLAWWHTTVTTAINLVALLGAARVGLLGLDGRDATDGANWHHEPHPSKWGAPNPQRYACHGAALCSLVSPLQAMGVQCFNLNQESTHQMFSFSTLDEFLFDLEGAAMNEAVTHEFELGSK